MSDIRSFFGKKKVDKASPAPAAKKKRLVISDSDDDDILELPVPAKKARKTEDSGPSQKPAAKVNPLDFFGSSKVKKNTVVSPSIKKKNEVKKNSDDELFEDESFMETLDQLEKITPKAKENVTPPKSAPCLAAKLSEKKKVQGWKEKVGLPSSSSEPTRKRPREETVSEDNLRKPNGDTLQKSSRESSRKSSGETSRKSSEEVSRKSSEEVSRKSSGEVSRKSSGEASRKSSGEVSRKSSGDSSITEKSPAASSDANKSFGKAGYWAYKNREGPKNLGSKEIPQGAENCLEGLTFVISGVLDSLERDDAASLIKRYGGRVTSAVSKKTNYLVTGEGCGEKKLEMAEKHKTRQIDEDGLLDLIRAKPAKKSIYDTKAENDNQALAKEREKAQKKEKEEKKEVADKSSEIRKEDSIKKETPVKKEIPAKKDVPVKKEIPGKATSSSSEKISSSVAWTEKYRPAKVKEIIGQQGDKSNVNKLLRWLKNWERHNKPGNKAPFNKDDGSHLKAALLSGPPGVGKTTSATVCAKELGFTYVEWNASDTRSKKSIQEQVATLVDNRTIGSEKSSKHLLIMDEVDGMAGNEDRGGIAQLIQLIKTSRIPIICICNDRNHQKIRSLSNYCLDLRFYKPRLEQIKGAMMSIAFREGIRVPPPAMQRIIEGANNDIRQILNQLCVWSAGNKSLTFDEATKEAKAGKKDAKIGIFDIPRLFFSAGEETRRYTYHDYSDLFFQDYSLTPLLMQENYLRAGGSLRSLSHAADSMCVGDKLGTAIKMENWSLLPTQAHFSAIMPGFYMRGGLNAMTAFPQTLGQMSKKNRCDGLLQDLLNHMSLHVSTDKRQLGMDYLPLLRRRLLTPLVKHETEGVPEVLEMMNCYDLQRDDWDTIMELSTYSPNTIANLSTKTKTAFTRLYNKQSHMNPYAVESKAKKKAKNSSAAADEEEGGEEEENEDADDGMIKKSATKKPAAKKSATKKPATKKPATKKPATKKPGTSKK